MSGACSARKARTDCRLMQGSGGWVKIIVMAALPPFDPCAGRCCAALSCRLALQAAGASSAIRPEAAA